MRALTDVASTGLMEASEKLRTHHRELLAESSAARSVGFPNDVVNEFLPALHVGEVAAASQ